MNKHLLILLPLLLAGCASSEKVVPPLDADPRVGDEVRQVCFTRNIDSWQDVDNDRNAVIVKTSPREYYKLALTSGCDPQWAMLHMAIISRPGSSCVSRGDRVKTDGDAFQGHGTACLIKRINKWDPDAVKQVEQKAETESPPAR